MDGSRFDHLTRSLLTRQTRRQTLRGALGSALAGVLGLSQSEDAAAACIKPNKKGCKGPKNGKCCDGATCQGGTKEQAGRCKCKRAFKQCGDECVNTKKDKQHCGSCNKRCKGQNTCKQGKCTSKLGCKVGGNSICNDPPLTSLDDPRICNTDGTTFVCICITDVNGVARCSDLEGGVCANCTTNADCPDGFVCFDASGPNCGCATDPASNGNACIPADCQGVSGSSTGRRGQPLRSPILR